MGRVDSKIAKCRNKAKSTWWRMKGKKSRGIIERDEKNGIVKVAKPIGVVGCISDQSHAQLYVRPEVWKRSDHLSPSTGEKGRGKNSGIDERGTRPTGDAQ